MFLNGDRERLSVHGEQKGTPGGLQTELEQASRDASNGDRLLAVGQIG